MTKQEFIKRWNPSHMLIADLESVIATEIDKAKEQPEKPSSKAKLDNSFDRNRFEAMFRAVVASGELMTIVEEIEQTEIYLTKLDAYYASKEGGNNG